MPLRMKSLAVDTVIDRQVAVTRQTLIFKNDTNDRVEADFIYTVAPDTLVTYFAYWFGDEKVVARVVEKERAAAIYRHITTRMRDPALIELVGKNTFRARIFPVEPNADLKVEMVLVQAIPSTPQGALYTLPLQAIGKMARLDSIDIAVRVRPSGDVARVENNYGLPVASDGDGFRFTLRGSRFRPQKDVRLSLVGDAKPLRATLYAAPSGSADGFFALALTPDSAMTKPTVQIRGVSTYAVIADRPATLHAHRALLVVGRYRGSGDAVVSLEERAGGRRLTQTVRFGAQAEPNNPASKLWAARRIAALSGSQANRDSVIALSQRYTLPSKFTSWLAVPKAELERYRQEKAWADVEVATDQLVREIVAGRARGQAALALRARLKTLSRQAGYESAKDVPYMMEGALGRAMSPRARLLAREISRDRGDTPRARKLREELTRVARETDPGRDYRYWVNDELKEMAEAEILTEQRKARPDPRRLRRLEKHLIDAWGGSDFGRARAAWLAARAEVEMLDRQLAKTPPGDNNATLYARYEKAMERESELYLRARIGDPLLQVDAPPDAQQVVALMPGGEIKPLVFNPASGKWEARFDIPAHAGEGKYRIRIVIVQKDAMRKTLTLVFTVDMTPPAATGAARSGSAGDMRLEIEVSDDTARVVALLPWGEKVALQRLAADGTCYGATVAAPEAYRNTPHAVTFVVTDRAHNRTTVTVDLSEE